MSDESGLERLDAPAGSGPSGRLTGSRRHLSVLVAALVVVVLGWIAVLPPSAGSDEPGHVVRSAALVRGELDGEGYLDIIFDGSFELPAWIGWPEPECWAFKLEVAVGCSTLLDEPSGTILRGTRSADYPIWGHVLPGVPTLVVDDPIGNRLARVFHAIVPLGLIIGSLVVASRRGRVAAAATLVSVTPVAVFFTATVNPSGLVIAGGIALWTALASLAASRTARSSGSSREGPSPDPAASPSSVGSRPADPDRLVRWLAAAGWAAMVLPRRDGMIYACTILAIVLGVGPVTVDDLRRLLRRPQAALVGASTVAVLAWAATSDSTGSFLLFAAPLAPIGVAVARVALLRAGWSRPVLSAVVAATTLVVAVVAVIFVQDRDPELDTVKWRAIAAETGADLFEAFGVLGWLDAPMPASFAYLFVGILGVLVGAVALARPEALVPPAVVLVVAILMSWWLTASRVGGSAEYWQGRYYLPLLVGVPILLGSVDEVRRIGRTSALARGVGVAVAVVSVVALAAAMRRFAVGIDGTMAPWRWHTFGAAVSPLFPLVVIALAWIPLLRSLDRLSGEHDDERRRAPESEPDPLRESVS